MQTGQGQGLSQRFLGEQSGTEAVTLLLSEIPVHTHNVMAVGSLANLNAPGPTRALARSSGGTIYQAVTNQAVVQMAPQSLSPAGGSLPHNNMQPYLTVNFCIALQGIFPARP
jgi:microcystin-dependent protein